MGGLRLLTPPQELNHEPERDDAEPHRDDELDDPQRDRNRHKGFLELIFHFQEVDGKIGEQNAHHDPDEAGSRVHQHAGLPSEKTGEEIYKNRAFYANKELEKMLRQKQLLREAIVCLDFQISGERARFK